MVVPSSLSFGTLLRLRFDESGPLSANCRLSTGHGKMCGIPTTRKETAKHPVKSDRVDRDRGWRYETILVGLVEMCFVRYIELIARSGDVSAGMHACRRQPE